MIYYRKVNGDEMMVGFDRLMQAARKESSLSGCGVR
jgi:hypothetical protein